MSAGHTRGWPVTVALLLLAFPGQSRAEGDELKVKLQVNVVHVSNQGTHVDEGLAPMKEAFSRQHFLFTSFRLLTSQRVTLHGRRPEEVALPNKRKAKLSLLGIASGTAKVTVSVEKGPEVTYELGREGSVFINTGRHQGGELVLMLSPIAVAAP